MAISTPLARKLLRKAERRVRDILYMPDPDPTRFTLAIDATTDLENDPVWGLVVGGSSMGKTELIRALDTNRVLKEFSVAGLLSSVSGGKGKPRKPSGLLADVGDGKKSLITIWDMSSILGMSDHRQRADVLSTLRDMYDGAVSRDLYGMPVAWHGKVTLVGGATHAIDVYAAFNDKLGTRWLMLRLPEPPPAAELMMTDFVQQSQDRIDEYRASVKDAFRAVSEAAQERAPTFSPNAKTSETIREFSVVCAHGRAAVSRSSYGAREILGSADVEGPGRVHKELLLLWQGARAIGLTSSEAVALCRRVAQDTMPRTRAAIMHKVVEHNNNGGVTAAQAAKWCQLDYKVASRSMEDLGAAGLLDSPYMHENPDTARGMPNPWSLTDKYRQMADRTFRHST